MSSIPLSHGRSGRPRWRRGCEARGPLSSVFSQTSRSRWCSSASTWSRFVRRSISTRRSRSSRPGRTGSPRMEDEIHVSIETDADLVVARAEGRAMAQRLGFRPPDATLIATAISEVARNVVVHVGHGEIIMRPLVDGRRLGVLVIVRDEGEGIPDVDAALGLGHASRGDLGLGLPGARRLMDEFEVEAQLGKGTTVTMRKWRVRDELELLREKRERRRSDPA